MSTEPNTPGTEELPASVEQRTIPTIDESQQEPAPEQVETPPAAVSKKEDDVPADPRAARLEALAENAHQNRQEESAAVAEAMAPAVPAAAVMPEPAAPERMLKLKIRGEIVELPESEVIARAQKVDAADQYISEAKDLLKEAKATVRQPVPEPAPAPAPVEKVDNVAKAIELIQTGGDPVEARALLDTELSERATRAAEQVVDGRSSDQRSQRYDADLVVGFQEAATEYPDLMASPVGQSTVKGLTGSLQAHVIAEHLTSLAPEVQQAFATSGITPDTLKNYSPDDAGALYKDMLLKGYRLPRPSEVTKAAAKTVADFYAGSTKPAPAPTPEPAPQPALDRTARKEAINQPERTAIPKPTARPPAPRSEPQRAASARQELRASRRRGSA